MHRCTTRNTPSFQVWVLTISQLIRPIKQSLEDRGHLDQYSRIFNHLDAEDLRHFTSTTTFTDAEFSSALPTTIFLESSLPTDSGEKEAFRLFQQLGLDTLNEAGNVAVGTRSSSAPPPAPTSHARHRTNPLSTSVHKWLLALSPNDQDLLPVSISDLLSSESWTYQKYPPMLLLPATTFKSTRWTQLLASPLRAQLSTLYASICASMDVTHIAINAPIPPSIDPTPQQFTSTIPSIKQENILRSPLAIQPLYGDFGSPDTKPSAEGFERAFWACVRQNEVLQMFAPLHTMFSKGNITEKQRVLGFPGLGGMDGGTTAVDLYAGIGYFAFMYAKAGAECMLGWELNEWSVEGFRRGAKKNKWAIEVIEKTESDGGDAVDNWVERVREARLTMFAEDNRKALGRIQKLRKHIPPVRHVNCGYLPTSKDSWDAAVQILDPKEGGWIHAHENVAETDIDRRKEGIKTLFAALAYAKQDDHTAYLVACEHVERVKSYAPGVMHCVFDIRISPMSIPTPPLAL